MCVHPPSLLRRTETPGITRCLECGDTHKCDHPQSRQTAGHEITVCAACDEITAFDRVVLVAQPSRMVYPPSHLHH